MTNSDANNPLLSTPVAKVAIDLFKATLAKSVVPLDQIKHIADGCTHDAEAIVSALIERGHLPPQKIEVEEEPKADDATLILQGMMAGIVLWEPYEVGDLRGTLYITGAAHHERFRCVTKLKRGIPEIDDPTRKVLMERLAHTLRHL